MIGLGGLAVVAIALLAIFGLASKSTPAAGRSAPALPTETLVGPRVTIPAEVASTHGRPFEVLFFASWCEPCIHEAPQVERFAQSAAGHGRIVAVDWSDGRSGAVSFIHHFGWSFPVLRDGEGTVGNRYEFSTLPTTFVLNGAGRIRATLHGPQTEASLAQALAAQEAA